MLRRIEARNFKSFKQLDYACARLNVLMGLNGAGKSSFVQLLLTLRFLAHKMLSAHVVLPLCDIGLAGVYDDLKYKYAEKKDAVFIGADFQDRVCDCSGKASMNRPHSGRIERILSRNTSDINAHSVIIDHPHYEEIRTHYFKARKEVVDGLGGEDRVRNSEDLRLKESHLLESVEDEKKRAIEALNCEEMQKASIYRDVWDAAHFIGSLRDKPGSMHTVVDLSELTTGEMRSGVRDDPKGGQCMELLYRRWDDEPFLEKNSPMLFPCKERNLSEEARSNSLQMQVNAWLSVVSPGATVRVDCLRINDDELLKMSIGFDDENPSCRYAPQHVGFGISDILPILVTILSSFSGDVLIIENPEAHLHPKGQAAMGNLIARAVASGVQVFVETHSDHVVNGIRSAVKDGIVKPSDVNIAFFERKEHNIPNDDGTSHQEIYSEVRNIRVDKNGSLSEYPDGFLDEWNNQLMELI